MQTHHRLAMRPIHGQRGHEWASWVLLLLAVSSACSDKSQDQESNTDTSTATRTDTDTDTNTATGTGGMGSGGSSTAGGTGGTAINTTCPGDASNAYRGTPGTVPGTVEAEDFDVEGYSDSSTGNEGGAYRTDVDVDIKEFGNGYAIGWMTAGETLDYTVNVPAEGDYTVTLRAGAVDAGRTLELSQCGTALATIDIPQIAEWGEMATTAAHTVHLTAGLQVVTITVGATDFIDFDSISFESGPNGTGGAGGDTGGTGGVGGGITGEWPPSATYSNPVLWEDLADTEVIRVGDTYYYTASNMHYSPGAPILRSYDLVEWEYAGHAIPVLDFSNSYDLNGGRAYVKGTWASTFTYRESNSTFYWLGCIEFGRTYVYTASSVEGPWTKHPAINNCYYDAGYLVDDDDTMYVAYGNRDISVAQLSADGFSEVQHQLVYTVPASENTLEGARFYKRNGYYYIFLTRPANGQFILRSTDPFGPYERHTVLDSVRGPISGGGVPHQGALVDTPNGDWYYMAFIDAYPGGRVPALAPITWSNDWPVLELVNGEWGASYPYPDVPRPPRAVKPTTGRDSFTGSTLGHEWEWNHNPDDSKWSVGNGLTLQTATVTNDLYSARNTLTHRILGPSSTATIELDYSAMADGDRAGLAMLRQSSAWIGIKKSGGTTRVVMVDGLTMDSDWNTTGTGTEQASAEVSGGTVWLRVAADISPGSRQARFSYSTDGNNFTPLGSAYTLNNEWQFFMGYRYAIFNHATQSLGGAVTVPWFEVSQ